MKGTPVATGISVSTPCNAAQTLQPEADIVTGPFSSSPTVLNVNDHDGARYTVSRMLARAGFEVEEATTGTQAIAIARNRQPRLLVLDVKLPDTSGLDVCRRIKSDPDTAHIKILHTSAVFVSTHYKVRSLESGADGYLTHPFEQEELIAIARSLLRLSETERDLRDVAAHLREANNRIHEFLAMLSHELRNPLSAIAAGVAVLSHRAPRDEAEAATRAMLQRQTDNLRRMVDDLLDVARVTQGKIEPHWDTVDLNELLRRVGTTACQTRIDARRQQLVVDLPPGVLPVRADPVRLEQVFTNVLDNASKYTPDGGRVQMRATRLADDWLRVDIEDNGAGIARDALPKVFDLFEQADVPLARSNGGLGVGLTLVRSLVEMHGGHVQAFSAGIGKGTRLEIALPALCDSLWPVSRVSDDPSPWVQPPSGASRRVLIVEDNEDAREALKLLLETWGHQVHVAADGPAGVEAILRVAPDVAFVDIGLPRLDGYAVARRIIDACLEKRPKMVALTGYGDPQQREAALAAGFDDHVVKPADPRRLQDIVQSAAQIDDAL